MDTKKLGITERDSEVMRAIYEEQFLSIGTVSKYFFNNIFQNASERIIRLVRFGYLRYESLFLPRQPKVVRLTPKGLRFCKGVSPFQIQYKRRVSLSTFSHDTAVGEVRLRLKSLFDASWIPEKAMKANDFKKVPDGILVFQSGRKIAVELENTQKANRRYEEMWREWERHDFMLILYVSTSPVLFRALKNRMSAFQTTKIVLGLIEMNDLLSPEPSGVWTSKGALQIFARRSF